MVVFLLASFSVNIPIVSSSQSNPYGHRSKARIPRKHPNPDSNRLKWVVHLPQNGTIGFDP